MNKGDRKQTERPEQQHDKQNNKGNMGKQNDKAPHILGLF